MKTNKHNRGWIPTPHESQGKIFCGKYDYSSTSSEKVNKESCFNFNLRVAFTSPLIGMFFVKRKTTDFFMIETFMI